MLDDPNENDRLIRDATQDLEGLGLSDAAARLRAAHEGTYTTSSEYLGEMGLAVRAIRRGHRLPRELDQKLKRLVRPTFSERIVLRQLWQAILVATILLMFGGVVVALVTAKHWATFGYAWIAFAAAMLVLMWVASRRVSPCPGCGTRLRQLASSWCPYCGADLATGSSGPKVTALPTAPKSTLLRCPNCGNPPGGRGRYGTTRPSEGHFCSFCGERLPAG